MIEADLYDTVFAHDVNAVAGVPSTLINWERSNTSPDRIAFFSHEQMLNIARFKYPRHLRFGLLYESQAILPRVYRDIEKVMGDFQTVFTHSSKLLEQFSNAKWIPGSGVWIGGAMSPGEKKVYHKTKNCSILSSNKLRVPLHRKRYLWAQRLKMSGREVDTYIQEFRTLQRISPLDTLREYRYSICVENFIDSRYFTEKLLNCFATGTVPVYLGATKIGQYFDEQGIITFENYSDLVSRVLPKLHIGDYESRLTSIRNNFEIVSQYGALEDFIARTYLRGLV